VNQPTNERRERVDPESEGSRMRWQWEVEPGCVLSVMTPLIARTGRHQEETIWAGRMCLLEEQRSSL
jgi:hypothetical protein